MTTILLAMIRGYQHSFSKLLPPSCRYYPSCSQYTYEAVEKYGWFRGGWMAAARIARCHPFAKGGYDPVPCSASSLPGAAHITLKPPSAFSLPTVHLSSPHLNT